VSEREFALRVQDVGDVHPGMDHRFAGLGKLGMRGIADRAGLRKLAHDAFDPMIQDL
jgi:hypothetical protein